MSCNGVIGTTPAILVRPAVGLMPTTELEPEGHKMDPSVSLPRDPATKFAATDIADPLLDPPGSSMCMDSFSVHLCHYSSLLSP